jgi:hypothetical protein
VLPTSADPLLFVTIGIVALSAFVTLGAVRPALIAPLLVLGGSLMTQPNLFGFRYSAVGAATMLAGAGVAFVQDRIGAAPPYGAHRALGSPVLWMALAYLWLLLRVVLIDGTIPVPPIVTGGLVSITCMLAVLITVTNRDRALVLAKLFAGLMVASCASYAVTLIIWLVAGFGNAQIGAIVVGSWPLPEAVYFPFTTTVARSHFLGLTVPRFTGIGREPGWMALYCVFVFFLLRQVFPKRRVARLLVLVGLIGTVSTAGFGVFVGCFALAMFLGRRASTPARAMLRTGWYLLLGSIALWLILFAPVLGVAAKGQLNAVSLSERTTSTNAGITALVTNPFPGGLEASTVGGLNLISTVAAYGLLFSATVLAAILGPLRTHPHKRALLTLLTPIAITLIAAQPPRDSTWIYCLVIIAAAITLRAPADTPAVPALRPTATLRH